MYSPDTYLILRTIHISAVATTGTLMLARMAMALRGTDYRQVGALRWIPHAVDTVLLASAIALIVLSGQYPFVQPWLSAKLIALAFYILLGTVALDPSRPRNLRIPAGIASILTYVYIVSVAITRDPLPILN